MPKTRKKQAGNNTIGNISAKTGKQYKLSAIKRYGPQNPHRQNLHFLGGRFFIFETTIDINLLIATQIHHITASISLCMNSINSKSWGVILPYPYNLFGISLKGT